MADHVRAELSDDGQESRVTVCESLQDSSTKRNGTRTEVQQAAHRHLHIRAVEISELIGLIREEHDSEAAV
jgi:hypothetical protein